MTVLHSSLSLARSTLQLQYPTRLSTCNHDVSTATARLLCQPMQFALQ